MSQRNWVVTAVMVGALLRTVPTVATSQEAVTGSKHVFVGGYLYEPSFGHRASLRLDVTPKNAAVFVDGFYAGTVDDFRGPYDRLAIPPGGHSIVLFVEGYCTVRRYLYLSPGLTFTMNVTMGRLAPGVRSELPPAVPVVPALPPGSLQETAPAFESGGRR